MKQIISTQQNRQYILNNFSNDSIWKDILTMPNVDWVAKEDFLIVWTMDKRSEIYYGLNYDLNTGKILTGVRFYIDDNYPNFKIVGYYDLSHIIKQPTKFLKTYQPKLDMEKIGPRNARKINSSISALTHEIYENCVRRQNRLNPYSLEFACA